VLEAGQLAGDTSPKLSGPGLIKELQKGGYIIYFRHGATNEAVGEKDVADADLEDCARQRNLSDAGQAQTKGIGAAFKVLKIPTGAVYTSPYCRCIETARNIFGKGAKNKALHFAIHLRTADRGSITVQLLDLLATVPPPGTNVAMVSHTANLQEAVGLWPKPEGVAHIFKPRGDGTFTYVGVMQPEAWELEARRSPEGSSWFGRLIGR
jgi:phosphohistidine phosphatase SixA